MPPVRATQHGFPAHPFPAASFPLVESWSAYDLDQFLWQTNPHLPPDNPQAHAGGAPLEANKHNDFSPPPSVASPLTPISPHSPTARRGSRASSALSGNDSPATDPANSQGAQQRPLTQMEVDAAMIAEEKRRRNTAASGGLNQSSSSRMKACFK
jgi:hypothetical protein